MRLRLLHLLTSRDEVCVCYRHEALELPQPTVSRHLTYLRKSGLVASRKEGLWVHYRLAGLAGMLHRLLLGCVAEGLGDLGTLKFVDKMVGPVRLAEFSAEIGSHP